MKKYLLILFSLLLAFLLPTSVYAEDSSQQYTITVKYVFHAGYVEDDNIIYQFSGDTVIAQPGDDVFIPTVGISNFSYHIDGYPDEMTWNLGVKEVLGGGNPDPLQDDDWANFHTPSMIAENVDIIFHYCPNTDLCLLEHYFEQQDGSYVLQKTQKTKLGIYEVFAYEYDLSKYHLTVDNYTFDENNENNVLIGYPNFRTVDKNPFVFKYYYNLIQKETETTTTEQTTTVEETTTQQETITQEQTTEPSTEQTTEAETQQTTAVEQETTSIVSTAEQTTTTEETTTIKQETTSKSTEQTTETEAQQETTTTIVIPTTQQTTTNETASEPTTATTTETEQTTTTQQTQEIAVIPVITPPRNGSQGIVGPPPAPQEPTTVQPSTEKPTQRVEQNETTKVQEIKEEEIPLSAPTTQRHWALLNLLLTIGSTIISIVLAFLFLFNRKNKKEYSEYAYDLTYKEEKQYRRNIVKRFISVIITIIMMFIFAITEDITLPMQFTDQYTILMAIIFIIHIALAIIWQNWLDQDDNEEDEY